MGGIGSGRHYRWDTKDTIEDYRTIDIRRWHREKLLIPGQSFLVKWTHNGKSIHVNIESQQISLSYRHHDSNDNCIELNYSIYLSWSFCYYGNKRPWFLCPIKGCGRQVAILYGGKIFGCRRCYQLVYPCQRESFPYRVSRRAEKIRDKLAWEAGCLNGHGLKPKGMHKKTFKRLSIQHDIYVVQATAWFGGRLSLIDESIEDWI